MLNAVVLPAPLGPINATISPALMENSRLFTATRPPNRRVRFLISRMATHFIPDEPARPGRKSRRFHLRLLLSLALYATTDPPQRFSVKRFMGRFILIAPFRRGCADGSTRRDRLAYQDRRRHPGKGKHGMKDRAVALLRGAGQSCRCRSENGSFD